MGKRNTFVVETERKLDGENGFGREGGSEGFAHRSDLPKLSKFRFFVSGVIKVICEHIVATIVFYQILP